MNGDEPTRRRAQETAFAGTVAAKARRKLWVLRGGKREVWFGLGMSGLIGWSVAVPTVVGAMVGLWWDRRHPGPHSWTLAMLVAGLVVGCANAWHWIAVQDEAIRRDANDTEAGSKDE